MENTSIITLTEANIYQRENLILENISLTLNRGEFAYLIGKTGSGKSSLLKVLYGDLPLKSGSGFVAGENLKKLSVANIPELRRKIGIVFQDFQLLYDRSVRKNLLFVLKATGWKNIGSCNARIESVLSSVGMLSKIDEMPYKLSGGEQQRVAIARALLNKPELILADEPTGNLDPDTSKEIMILLREVSYQNECGVFMATHDYQILNQFPAKTIKCENGGIKIANSLKAFTSSLTQDNTIESVQ